MKKIIFLIAFSMLFSCSKSDNSNSTTDQNTIVGTYKLTESNSTNAVDLNNDGVFNTNVVKETSCFEDDRFYFRNDGTCESVTKNLTTAAELISCNAPFITDKATWTENATSVITISSGGTRKTWLKEGNSLRYSPGGYFLWTKQ